jgi:hypothetical protein
LLHRAPERGEVGKAVFVGCHQLGVTITPTLALAEDGREIGRIVGYPGEDFFYGLLANLLKSKQR